MQQLDDFKTILKIEYGIDGDFVESQAFAYLAIRSYLKAYQFLFLKQLV